MKTKISFVLVIMMMLTIGIHDTSWAGDKEWRRFGEAAAILWGVRALTGWDPVGRIVEYPRDRYLRDREVVYQKPTNVYIQTTAPVADRISAFPPGYSSSGQAYKSTSQAKPFDDDYPIKSDEFELPPQKTPSNFSGHHSRSMDDMNSFPNRADAKPPIPVSKKIEGDYEIETKKIWVAPHWEKKIIEGHWRGDTWVDTHTEKRWVEGEWKLIEDRKLRE